MADFSAQEQLMLELINRARLDPNAEAARLGITLNQGIGAGTISSAAKQPLAPNLLLVDAARSHSQHMIDTDLFAHEGIGDGTPEQRMANAGYAVLGTFTSGENIAFRGTFPGAAPFTAFVVQEHEDLFLSTSGHRQNILDNDFREIGIGALVGQFVNNGTNFNSVLTTQNLGTRNNTPIVTGVAYNDTVNDDFYSVGEGRSGISVLVDQAVDQTTTTAPAGGYAVTGAAGAADVVFSGGGLAASVTVGITIGSTNVKIDLVNSNTIESSASATLKSGAAHLKLLGIAAINGTGTNAANRLEGGTGKNKLTGLGGNDILDGDKGADILNGGLGADDFDYNALSDSGLTNATRDSIQGFQRGIDDIDLRTLDARSGVAGNQAFTFIGSQGFHDRKGELHLVDTGANIRVEGDVTGDGRADFSILVLGVANLAKGDFLL